MCFQSHSCKNTFNNQDTNNKRCIAFMKINYGSHKVLCCIAQLKKFPPNVSWPYFEKNFKLVLEQF